MESEIVYCLDNSYAYNQRTGQNECLGGTLWHNEATPVRVMLSPFKMKSGLLGLMHEFVVVEDPKGDRHVVLNRLGKHPIDWKQFNEWEKTSWL